MVIDINFNWGPNLHSEKILMKLNELATQLNALADQQEIVITEIQSLKDALVNTDIPADAQAALDRLTAAVATADALNP